MKRAWYDFLHKLDNGISRAETFAYNVFERIFPTRNTWINIINWLIVGIMGLILLMLGVFCIFNIGY
jgi:hypothetical protein